MDEKNDHNLNDERHTQLVGFLSPSGDGFVERLGVHISNLQSQNGVIEVGIRFEYIILKHFLLKRQSYKQMTSRSSNNRFTRLSKDEILYRYYSYDWLQYPIDILRQFYETYKKNAEGKDPLFDKRCSVIKFEIIVKFSHYAEVVGAFFYPCHIITPDLSSADILENLSKYTVPQIDQFYQELKIEYILDDNKRNNFNRLLGYDRIKFLQGEEQLIDGSVSNVIEVLKAIGEFYGFWKDSYNAYKHGYRVWFGDEEVQKLNVVSYLKKYNKSKPENDVDHLPIDDETITEIHNLCKYCRNVLDIIFDNNRALLDVSISSSNKAELDLLDYKEPEIKINKKQFDIK